MSTSETILTKQGHEFYGHNPAGKEPYSEARADGAGCVFTPYLISFFGGCFSGNIPSCTNSCDTQQLLVCSFRVCSLFLPCGSRKQSPGPLHAENAATEAELAQRIWTAYLGSGHETSSRERSHHWGTCSWAQRFLHGVLELARSTDRTVLLILYQYPLFFCSREPARGYLVSCSIRSKRPFFFYRPQTVGDDELYCNGYSPGVNKGLDQLSLFDISEPADEP
jgi:hypothetical protein